MKRNEILTQLWNAQDTAFDLMSEYDSLPHKYGDNILYQAEAYLVREVGSHPNITITELAKTLRKTTSACSQLVRKLVAKGLIEQTRNKNNKRIYNLTLTPTGKQLYKDHMDFNVACQQITFKLLSQFSDEELQIHTKVQEVINRAYEGDVDRAKEKYQIES